MQFGAPVWRVGKRSFALLYDYGKGLTHAFLGGHRAAGPTRNGPAIHAFRRISGTNGWIALDASKSINERELREFLVESYRHFATRRALAKLDAVAIRCLASPRRFFSTLSLSGVS